MSSTVKLAISSSIIVGVTGYMAYLGTARSWKYYLTVDECLAGADELHDRRTRVSGTVVADSLAITADRTQATFQLGGTDRHLWVTCAGPLPDNLAENIEVVVEGTLDDSGRFVGENVLTRCSSKYAAEPPRPTARRTSQTGEGAAR